MKLGRMLGKFKNSYLHGYLNRLKQHEFMFVQLGAVCTFQSNLVEKSTIEIGVFKYAPELQYGHSCFHIVIGMCGLLV